jgi:hypothetical protein
VHATDVTLTLPPALTGGKAVMLKGKANERVIEGTVDGGRWRATRVAA